MPLGTARWRGLAVVVFVIAWLIGWRRETREHLDDLQQQLDRIEASIRDE